MGHPLTWLTLSIAHAAILHMTGLLDHAAVKGDDALVRGSSRDLNRYLVFMELAGFVINDRKTFWSRDAGIFCERGFDRRFPQPMGAVPVKRVVAPTLERLANLARQIDDLPKNERARYRRAVWRAAGASGLINTARRHAIPIALPRQLGGLGVPHRRGLPGALNSSRRWASARLTQVGSQIPIFTSMAESLAYEWAYDGTVELTRTLHRRGDLGDCFPMDPVTWGRFISLRSFAVAMVMDKIHTETTWASYAKNAMRWRRRFLRGQPRKLINPSLWSWSRLDGVLARAALAGMYATTWHQLATSRGITFMSASCEWDP